MSNHIKLFASRLAEDSKPDEFELFKMKRSRLNVWFFNFEM